MEIKLLKISCFIVGMFCFLSTGVLAQDLKPISLSPPIMVGGKPLMEALKERRSTKSFSPQPISMEIIANMLWAANGINRPDGRRTAPSAANSQNIDIYVLLAQGVYLYDVKAHSLVPVLTEDLRLLVAGPQDYAKEAPLHLLYVADYAKMGRIPEPFKKVFFSACNTGVICQNVELYCASEGLGAATRGTMDIPALHKKLKLRGDQEIMLNQVVGYPKK